MKAAKPLSVKGWLYNCHKIFGGRVATCAPAIADSKTWLGLRMDADKTWVCSSG